MFDLTRHPRLLKLLSLRDRTWAFLRRRNAGRREADSRLPGFYAGMWKQAAEAVGANIEDLGLGIFEIRLGDACTRVVQNSTALDDLATYCIARSKPVIYRLLNRHGVRTPRHAEFALEDMRPAVALLQSAQGDCVVKPGSGGGGRRGITTGIRTRWQLARAAYAASLFSDDLLIEEQIEGDNYRLVYLDGKLIDAVTLKTAINENAGADNVSAMGQLGEALIEEGARAAALARVRLAGVDVIARNPRVSLQESGGVILEVNTPPGSYWHYSKRDGAFPLAVHVLKALLNTQPSELCPS